MAWTHFPLTEPIYNFQYPAIWQELSDAISEREVAKGPTGYDGGKPIHFVNVDEHKHFFGDSIIELMMERIRLLLSYGDIHYVDHTDNAGNWDGVAYADIAPSWVWGVGGAHNILDPAHADVGNASTWTRRIGLTGGQVAYGLPQVGDMATHWTTGTQVDIAPYINEMYRVLDMLRWTWKPYNMGTVIGSTAQITDSGEGGTATEAWNDLVASWPAKFVPNSPLFDFQRTSSVLFDNPVWRANGTNNRGRIRTSNIPTHRKHTIDFYMYGTTLDEWDDDGLGYLEQKWNLIESQGPNRHGENISSLIGDNAAFQDRPVVDGNTRGWQLGEPWGVIKWDVPGGFIKVS